MSHLAISDDFPFHDEDPFEITSPETTLYNCIAWAYGVNDRWFWPGNQFHMFWPSKVPKLIELDSFIELFRSIGYEICDDGSFETGVEKIAIFCKDNKPTHAARQIDDSWSSKLGRSHDVSHTIKNISGGVYGEVAVFMKRERQ